MIKNHSLKSVHSQSQTPLLSRLLPAVNPHNQHKPQPSIFTRYVWIKYVVAILLQLIPVILIGFGVHFVYSLWFVGILSACIIALTVIICGPKPSIVATFVNATLLLFFVMPPYFSLEIADLPVAISLATFLFSGLSITLVTGYMEHIRKIREHTLLETNERMDNFFSIASHELKNPLTTISLSAQMAKKQLSACKPEDDPATINQKCQKALHLLERMESQINLQHRLIGDFLDVSRIRMDKLQLNRGNHTLNTLVENCVADIHLIHPQRSITITMPEETITASFDKERIIQVLTNYLTNAIKYSPARSPIHVSLSVNNNQALISVRDHGTGLTEKQQQRVWERFYRVQHTKNNKEVGVGLGLGLHICRTIIENHSGQVGVDSTYGNGSTFWFTLPL